MQELIAIIWDPSPFIIESEFLSLRWYTFLFILSFLVAYFKFSNHLKQEGVNTYWSEATLIIMVICIIVSARLGHVFLYQWGYYQNHLSEIFQINKGGLSSHGGTVGLFIASIVVSKLIKKKTFLWVLDTLATPLLLGGALIRLGNFFNQEIVGKPTDSIFGVIFPIIDSSPRFPVQLMESVVYFTIVGVCFYFERKQSLLKKEGYMIGLILTCTLIPRFFIEFLKESLSDLWIEKYLSLGQLLSLPLIFLGLFLLLRANRKALNRS